jgi:hypothetical protein
MTLEIGISICGDSTREAHLIFMVAPNGDPSHHISNRYPTIGRSEASDARTPNAKMVQNLNLDFSAMRFQTIMESIQRMAPEGSPLIALAQQGAKVANLIVEERSVGNPQREPYVNNRSNNRARRARSEAASSASGNHRLADNDARWYITENHNLWDYGHDRDDLRNIIEDRRHLRARTPSPSCWSVV